MKRQKLGDVLGIDKKKQKEIKMEMFMILERHKNVSDNVSDIVEKIKKYDKENEKIYASLFLGVLLGHKHGYGLLSIF